MFKSIRKDIRAAMDKDPAARSAFEILLCYSGVHALIVYRFTHWLWWGPKLRLMARFISQIGRFFTGIEIHPAAQIAPGLFIDHGMGVVIGETTIIGENVLIFQGVTLGGTGKEHGKRHPTIGNNVLIGVGAKVLGNITVGDGAVIGGGAVVLKNVPPNCTAVGVPARIVKEDGKRVMDLRHEQLPDPVTQMLRGMNERINMLERHVASLKDQHPEDRHLPGETVHAEVGSDSE